MGHSALSAFILWVVTWMNCIHAFQWKICSVIIQWTRATELWNTTLKNKRMCIYIFLQVSEFKGFHLIYTQKFTFISYYRNQIYLNMIYWCFILFISFVFIELVSYCEIRFSLLVENSNLAKAIHCE